jgi:hypothetical protein
MASHSRRHDHHHESLTEASKHAGRDGKYLITTELFHLHIQLTSAWIRCIYFTFKTDHEVTASSALAYSQVTQRNSESLPACWQQCEYFNITGTFTRRTFKAQTLTNKQPKWPTNSMEMSSTRETTICVATQEPPSISWNPKIHTAFTRDLHFTLSWAKTNPVHTTSSHLSKIQLNIISLTPPHPISPRSSLILSVYVPLFYSFFTFGCCILLRIYPTGSLWCRQSQQSFNTSTRFYFPSHSLHVSAPTGHLQVRYTIRYF